MTSTLSRDAMALYAPADDAQEALQRMGLGQDEINDLFDDVRQDIETVSGRVRVLVAAIRAVEGDQA